MLSLVSGAIKDIGNVVSGGYHDAVHYGSEGLTYVKGAPQIAQHLTETYVNPIFDPHPGPDAGELSPEAQKSLANQAAAQDPKARAELSFNAATQYMGEPGDMHDDDHSWKSTSAWSLSQSMAAALDKAKVTGNYSDFDKLNQQLQKYKNPDGKGYAADTDGSTGFGGSWYDDNSWIGLDYMQAYNQTHDKKYLTQAQDQFDFVKQGMYKGGVMWDNQQQPGSKTHPPTWNTCTEGPAAELALRLHMATNPKGGNDQYLQFATQVNDNMNKYLRRPDGVYNDHVDADDPTGLTAEGKAEHDDGAVSYNQGTPIGVNTLLYQATGQQKYLDAAQQTANTTLPRVEKKGIDNAPAYNAIYYRNLMQLDAVAPDPKYRQAMQNYADEAWDQGRDPSTGLFGKNGMASIGNLPSGSEYDLNDQMGMVQIYSLLAMSPSDYSQVS